MPLKSHQRLFLSDSDENSSLFSSSTGDTNAEAVEELMNLQPDGLIFNEDSSTPFSPLDHLINSWTGESILSTSALIIKKSLNNLWANALEQFDGLEYKNPKTKDFIFQELAPYLSEDEIQLAAELGINSIWKILARPQHPLHTKLLDFKNIFTFRTVVIYFFKLRFLSHLAKQIDVQLTPDDILNPSYFIQQYFPSGSSLYFTSLSLGNHPYSWFTPDNKYKKSLLKIIPHFLKINLTELTKIITFSQTHYLNFSEKNYSHALSHKEFGFFLNTLLIWLPKWLQGTQEFSMPITKNGIPSALRTRLTGDYLKSITLAYSLDQEQHISHRWKEITTVDIDESSFASANFFKICHEFQNLTLLTKVAEKQKHDTIPLIASVMKEKYLCSLHRPQGTLFQDTKMVDTFYKRIVLNLTSLPTKNTYYHLLKSVLDESKLLNDKGIILVFTNQKLFVPSQVDRLKTFFKKIKLETTCDFSELKGRGEITKYLYVFSKRTGAGSNQTMLTQKHLKENCPTFSFKGELLHFAQFKTIAQSFHSFLEHKDINQTPILVQQLKDNFTFQYFQDAIIDGRILSAGGSDSVNITHPAFFDKITRNCIPLKDAYQIELISEEVRNSDSFLGFELETDRNYPYVIVVDYKNPQIIKLQIISSDSLPAVKEQNGTVTSFYLKLLPLLPDSSIETLRTYFSNEIGQQIIQMTVHEKSLTQNKIQKNIENLLIPQFLIQPGKNITLSSSLENFFSLSQECVLKMSPTALKELYESNERSILSNLEKSTSETLGRLTSTNQTLKKYRNKLVKMILLRHQFSLILLF